jgi:hypothetical protein
MNVRENLKTSALHFEREYFVKKLMRNLKTFESYVYAYVYIYIYIYI